MTSYFLHIAVFVTFAGSLNFDKSQRHTLRAWTIFRTPTKKEWELDFTQQDITTICVGGTFVFCIILGGLIFSFHLKREERRKRELENETNTDAERHFGQSRKAPIPRSQMHPRPYLAKIQIESDELQTSSTDLGDSSDRKRFHIHFRLRSFEWFAGNSPNTVVASTIELEFKCLDIEVNSGLIIILIDP